MVSSYYFYKFFFLFFLYRLSNIAIKQKSTELWQKKIGDVLRGGADLIYPKQYPYLVDLYKSQNPKMQIFFYLMQHRGDQCSCPKQTTTRKRISQYLKYRKLASKEILIFLKAKGLSFFRQYLYRHYLLPFDFTLLLD